MLPNRVRTSGSAFLFAFALALIQVATWSVLSLSAHAGGALCPHLPELGQVFLISYPKTAGDHSAFRKKAAALGIGGIYLHARAFERLKSRQEVAALVAEVRSGFPAHHALRLVVDQEGGVVQPLGASQGFTSLPSLLELGRAGLGALIQATAFGSTLGRELAEVGIDWTFGPVMDVVGHPRSFMHQRGRSLSADPEVVSTLGVEIVRGIQEQGVVATAKHFPGHGSAVGDSHEGPAHIDKTWEELRASDLRPFAEAIRAGVGAVMMAHLTFNGLSEPATFSRQVVIDGLRNELGFTGVIVTDELTMRAALQGRTLEQAALDALRAGNDVLTLMGISIQRAEQVYSSLCAVARKDAALRAHVRQATSRLSNLGRMP